VIWDHFLIQKYMKICGVDTEFDEFSKLKNIFVELVVVDDGEDGLVQSLQLLHVVARHIAELNYAAATMNANI